jgi:hypothetical protein
VGSDDDYGASGTGDDVDDVVVKREEERGGEDEYRFLLRA